MRIGIDARELKRPYTGVGGYVVNLIISLSKVDFVNEYLLFVEDGFEANYKLPENFRFHFISPMFSSKLTDQFSIPLAINKTKLDVFHVPHHVVMPFLTSVPIVVTIHDIAWIDLGAKSAIFYKYYYYLSKFAVMKAAHIITVSKSTKERVKYHFPTSTPITSIPIACDPYYKIETLLNQDKSEILRQYDLNERYVLYVGSFAGRKNLPALLQAMKIVSKTFKDVTLVLAGKPSGRNDADISEIALGYKVVVIDRDKTLEELKILYQHAEMLVFPSNYEGFGLPVLEAITCGCPVVASNCTSLPEILGDAGKMVDPNDHVSLAKAMVEILTNPNEKEKMSQNGLVQSKKFNWEKTSIETLGIYKKLKDEMSY